MDVKRRTPKENPSEAYLKIRERKRWQQGFRRYVIESVPNENYAPYFGLDSTTLRKWFELQFTDELNWDSFATNWQFDHIVPVVYFDFSKEEELKLCWNFINLRVQPLQPHKNNGHGIDVMAVRPYFEDLYNKTGYTLCTKMLEKIKSIETSAIQSQPGIENFIVQNKTHLETIATFSNEEFNRLNQGVSIEDILLERELLRKFG